METKFVFSSSTIWGIVVASLVGFLDRNGYHVGDLVAPTASAVAQLINALAVFIPIVVAIRGRFIAAQPLHIFPPSSGGPSPLSPTRNVSAFVGFAAVSLLVLGLAGCGATSGSSSAVTPSGGVSAPVASAPTLLQTIQADFKGATNDALSFANALQKLNNGNALPPAAVTAILTLTHNSGDATTAASLNNLLGQFIAATATAATPAQAIANGNQVLAPANVQATVQAVAPSVAPATPTPTPTPSPSQGPATATTASF